MLCIVAHRIFYGAEPVSVAGNAATPGQAVGAYRLRDFRVHYWLHAFQLRVSRPRGAVRSNVLVSITGNVAVDAYDRKLNPRAGCSSHVSLPSSSRTW